MKKLQWTVVGYGASLAAAATATPAVSLGGFATIAATAPVIAPVLAAGLVGTGVAYLVKKILD
jgi:hypothetical protein